ncbi:MAG: protease inhibitor I42 family protein [Bacteroides sp.]|nr:protease inhibitor I42 family protein [Bacteroides sp.]
MIRRTFKVGDTITINRTTSAGTGYYYALARLSGGIALVGESIEAKEKHKFGGATVQSFVFQFLQPGTAEIQFVYYRDVKEILYEDVFSYVVLDAEETNTICGGWSEYEPLTEDDKKVFDACMILEGVNYTPLLVAKQVVSGYNYRFFCATETVTLKPKRGFAKVNIYAPLEGKPILEGIVSY